MNIQTKRQAAKTGRLLDGRVSVVTGSTSGIGLGIARALAEAGSALVLNGFGDAAEIATVQAQIENDFGVMVSYSAADMTKADAIADMIATTLKDHGRLDVLVNNAGIQHVAPVDQFPIEKWDAILAINLSSAFHTTRAALPAMRKCPSSGNLRLIRRFEKRGSGSSGLEFRRPAVGAASGGLR